MAKYLRPRRGTRTNAVGQNILLKRGEIFLEFPNSDIGAGRGKIIVGDGATSYNNITPFIEDPSLYYPRFNNSTYQTSNYTNKYNNSTETINKMNGGNNSTVDVNTNIEYIKQALCYEHSTLMAAKNALTGKASTAVVDDTYPGLLPKLAGGTSKYFRSDGTWQVPANDNTTYDLSSTASAGLVRQLPSDATSLTKFLAADGQWRVPPDTVYYYPNSTRNGLCRPFQEGITYRFLRADNTWATPPTTTYEITDDYKSNNSNTMLSSKGAHDFLQYITHGGDLVYAFGILAHRSLDQKYISVYSTVAANALASTWVSESYCNLPNKYHLIGALPAGGTEKGVCVTCKLESKSGVRGITVSFRNLNSTSRTIGLSFKVVAVRNTIT
jgi:hypothetical protein